MGAGQRRHRDRRPRQSVQRLRLSQAAGARVPAARCSCAISTCSGFGLAHDGAERFDSITPVLHGDIVVARAIFAPKDTDYLRYFDSFTNTATEDRDRRGRLGRRRRRVRGRRPGRGGGDVERRSRASISTDTFVTVMQNAQQRRRSDARTVGPRSVGARARHRSAGVLTARRRHVRRSVHRCRGPASIRRTSATSSR